MVYVIIFRRPTFQKTMDISVQIDYDDPEFFKALENPEGFFPILGDAMENILTVFEAVASEYAPESEANRPGRVDEEGHPIGYYERGRGWWYPLVTKREISIKEDLPVLRPHTLAPKTMEARTLLAEGIRAVAGYRLIPNSEQMHDQWEQGVGITAHEVTGFLRNTASYSDYVQGASQIDLHKKRGWQTVITSWNSPEVQRAVDEQTTLAIVKYFRVGV